MRILTAFLAAIPLSLILSSALLAQGQNFVLLEESRLPIDTSAPGTSTTDVDLVDVDGDGDLDIFKAEGTDSLAGRPNRLLINDGTGHFADETAVRLPAAVANSTKADFGDVDGDGDLDAIIANVGPEQLLLNDGHGVFADASAQLPPPVPIFDNISADARFADVDGDGDLDILVSNENPFPGGLGAQNRLWINNGSATFSDETLLRLPAAIDQTAAMLPGDVDQDGDLDVVVLNRGQETVLVNDGSGVFSDQTTGRFPVTSDTTRGGALADLDGDGDLDVVTGNSRGEAAAVYFNAAGVFTLGVFGMTPLPNKPSRGSKSRTSMGTAIWTSTWPMPASSRSAMASWAGRIGTSATTAAASSSSAPTSTSRRPTTRPTTRPSVTSMATGTSIWSWGTRA